MASKNVVDTICHSCHVGAGSWSVESCPEFMPELLALPEDVRAELLAHAVLLERFGPQLVRPHADTLKGSKHSNMKELRFKVDRTPWRVAYAFDRRRRGILLVTGQKAGLSQRLFYQRLINAADARLDAHLKRTDGK